MVSQSLLNSFATSARPRIPRDMASMLESEMILTTGPDKGRAIRLWPWQRLIADTIPQKKWSRIFARGSVQSSKTILMFVGSLLYYLFEIGEDVGLGVPNVDMGLTIYNDKILPSIMATRYSEYLPERGRGSRGGKTSVIRFKNGARLYFFGAGGGDESRSSHTVRVVILTELDKFDESGDASKETNPVSQIEARTTSFGNDAKIIGECTVSTEQGRIWRETEIRGTGGRIFLQCPLCGDWHYPERKNLKRWDAAETVAEAGRIAEYVCPKCDRAWNDDARRDAVMDGIPLLVHRGQSVENGVVVGDVPDTDTLGISWTAIHSPLVPISKIAIDEWTRYREDDESIEKKLCQFVWTLPYAGDDTLSELTFAMLCKRASDEYWFNPLGVKMPDFKRADERPESNPNGIPKDCQFQVAAFDVQQHEIYYLIQGFGNGLTSYSLVYGVVDMMSDDEKRARVPTEDEVFGALNKALSMADSYKCASVWCDVSYKHVTAQRHIVEEWCFANGVNAVRGRGHGQADKMTGKSLDLLHGVPDSISARELNGGVVWFIDVDRQKDDLFSRCHRKPGDQGCIWFPRDVANEQKTGVNSGSGCDWILRHFQKQRKVFRKNGSRTVREWVENRKNHLWDCAVYCLSGAYVVQSEINSAEIDYVSVGKNTGFVSEIGIRATY